MITNTVLFLFYSIILFSLVGCDDSDQGIPEKEVFVVSVEVPDTVQRGVEFNMKIELSLSGCWTFSRLTKELTPSSINYKAFAKNPSFNNPEVQCPTGFFQEIHQEKVVLDATGQVSFIFNDSSIIKNVIVKN